MKSTRLERDFSRVTMRFIPFRENDGNEFKSSSCACLLAAVYLYSRSLTFARSFLRSILHLCDVFVQKRTFWIRWMRMEWEYVRERELVQRVEYE